MVLVDRLAVEHRLDRRPVVVRARLVVAAGELGDVAVLAHVEVEPVVVVEPCRRARPPGGWSVIRCAPPSPARRPRAIAAMIARCASFSTGRSPPRIQMIAVVLVPSAEPLAVALGVRRGEDLRAGAAFPVPLVAPRRQHADIQPEAVRAGDDPVHVRRSPRWAGRGRCCAAAFRRTRWERSGHRTRRARPPE